MIPDSVELIDGGIVTTKELAQQAGDKFRAADVDLVILQLLTYATSYNMLPAVRGFGRARGAGERPEAPRPDYENTDTAQVAGRAVRLRRRGGDGGTTWSGAASAMPSSPVWWRR